MASGGKPSVTRPFIPSTIPLWPRAGIPGHGGRWARRSLGRDGARTAAHPRHDMDPRHGSRGNAHEVRRASPRGPEGSLWYASNGLFRQLGLGAWHNQTTREGLPTEIVWAVSRDTTGRLFAGTNMGLAMMEGGGWRAVPGSEKTAILSMVALPDGGLVGAGRPRALLYVPPGTARAVTVPPPFQNEPASLQVNRVFSDREGNAWVMGSRQIRRMVPRGQTLEPAEMLEAPEPSYLYNAYSSLQGRDGRFWFASRNGLAECFQGRWRLWKKEDGLLENRLYGLAEAPDGSLLISYYDSLGVSRLRLEGDRLRVVRNYRMDRGELPTDSVFSIHRDHANRIWLLTDVGAVLLKEDGFDAFGRASGLLSQDMVINSFFADRDGALWFGDARSLARFDFAAFPWDLPVPRPVFQDPLRGAACDPVEGEVARREAPGQLAGGVPGFPVLFPRQGLQLRSADRRARDLVAQGNLAEAALPGPSAGCLQVASPGGRQRPRGPRGRAAFRILPRWYQTWLFRLAVLAAVFTGLSGIVAWRQRRLKLVNERLEALVKSRTEELARRRAAGGIERHGSADESLQPPLPDHRLARAAGRHRPRAAACPNREAIPVSGPPLVFLLLDIDHFKQVNDEFGHDAGDDVLRDVGKILKSVARDTDSVVRWGGEEYLIVARYSGICDPVTLAERIRAAVEAHPFRLADGHEIHRTMSIGFCVFPLGSLSRRFLGDGRLLRGRVLRRQANGRNGWIGLYEGPEFDRATGRSIGRPDVADLLSKSILGVLSSRESIAPESWN